MVKHIRMFLKKIFSSKKHNSIPLIMQLPLYFLILCTCSLIAWYMYKNHSLVPAAEKKLLKIMYSTESIINAYLKTEEKNAHALVEMKETKKVLSTAHSNKQISKTILNNYETRISEEQKTMNFKNILLIDTHKTIQFASSTKELIGKKLSHNNSLLSLSFERAMMALTPDFSEYGHDPLFKKPTLFITIPVIDNKKFIGVLAYECNIDTLASLTNHYTGLGSSGEIVLAQKKDSFILFVFATRHDRDLAFKRKKISYKNPLATQEGILGKQGSGIAIDYRGIPVIGAWTFIPKINWGMIVKIDEKEIKKPLSILFYLLFLCFILIILWVFLIEYFYNQPYTKKIYSFLTHSFMRHIPSAIKNPFFIALLLSTGLLIKTVTLYYYKQESFSSDEKQKITNDIKEGAEDINQILKKISFTTESIADGLQLNRLSKEDITRRIKRDLAENENIIGITVAFSPYSYDPNTRLYAPSIYKSENSYQEIMIEDLYDYTNTNPHDLTTAWYRKALEQKGVWLNPKKDNKGNKIPPSYSFPFFDSNKQLQGVVCTTYKLDAIERITAYSSLDRMGYSILLSENGTFLSHPIHEFVSSEKTLLTYAQENESPSLTHIAEQLSHETSQLSSYTLKDDKNAMWIYTEPIPINNWTLAAVFSKEDMSLPSNKIRQHHFWIIFYSIISLLLACAYAYVLNKISLTFFIVAINLILSLGLMETWRIIQTTTSAKALGSTIITDQASLDNFLENLQEEAFRKNEESPIKIPCGLLLYSVGMLQPKEMTISGYLWNKYNLTNHANISHEMQIPHATKLIKDKPTTSIVHNWETVTWNIRGTIFQKQNYAQYPFDKQQMQITLEHHDIEKNIILIPDLEDYKKISPEETPGLDKNFTIAGFNVEKSFFTYKKIDPITNFGFSEYGKTTDHFLLAYNLIIKRNLLNPFVLFFLPLLVVLFSLFSVLLVARQSTKPLTIISTYTGLFFALVVLHRSLREQYPTNTTLYMEYAFFFAYITIILLVIHTVLIYLYPGWDYYQKKVFHFVKFIFWPLQLLSWLITTFMIFY